MCEWVGGIIFIFVLLRNWDSFGQESMLLQHSFPLWKDRLLVLLHPCQYIPVLKRCNLQVSFPGLTLSLGVVDLLLLNTIFIIGINPKFFQSSKKKTVHVFASQWFFNISCTFLSPSPINHPQLFVTFVEQVVSVHVFKTQCPLVVIFWASIREASHARYLTITSMYGCVHVCKSMFYFSLLVQADSVNSQIQIWS